MSEAVRKVIIKKVKKNHGGGHHGGSWKVAYADFVTAMMAFFLLLWLLSMVSEDKRIATAEYFKNFSIFKESGRTFQPGSAFVITDHIKKAEMKPENLATALKKALKNKASSDQILIDVIEGGVRVQIVDKEGSPMFQLGSAEPTAKAREILSMVYEEIKDLDGKIAIEGHTDAAPFRGDQITNWELSTMRASATRRLLESNGFDPTRVARVVGYADTELLIKDQPKDPQNRRISIIMMQPRENSPAAEGLKKDVRTSFQEPVAQTAQTPQPAQQAQPGTSDPAVQSAASKENAAKQSFQQKKAEMKKKKRDVMGLWE